MNQDLKARLDRVKRMDPMRSYLWRVELPVLPGWASSIVMAISDRVLSFNGSHPTIEAGKETQGNSFWYYANSTDIGEISLEVMEGEDGLTYQYFKAWYEMIVQSNGTFTPPGHYKKNVTFYRMNALKEEVTRDTYTGYFITGINDVTNDYEQNDVLKYTINFTGDSLSHEFVGQYSEAKFESILNRVRTTKGSLTEYLF